MIVIRSWRKIRFLLLLLVWVALRAVAQDEAVPYTDPAGHFSVGIPAGWTEESTADYGLFTNNGVSIALLTVEAENAPDGLNTALAIVMPGFSAEPVQSSELPAPNGIWTQKIYLLESGGLIAAFGQFKGELAYVMIVQAPDQEALQAVMNDINNVVLGFTIAGSVDLSGVVPSALTDAMRTDLEAYVTDAMERFDVPGAVVAVVQNNEVVYVNGFGVREIGSSEPITADTLFMVGSTTKSMTTMMIATLVDEGLLGWDTPVVDILPTFALSKPDVTSGIRVRDLVNMGSGVARSDIPMFIEALSPQQVIESLAGIPMIAEPGEEFNYSNQMVTTGGFLAALAAGADYSDDLLNAYAGLMQTRVFDPIGMTHTTLDFDTASAEDNIAFPHTRDLETNEIVEIPLAFERFIVPVAPAGATWSTAGDMARYLMTQINLGVTPDGTRIVSAENLTVTHDMEIAIAGPIGYGMGWVIEEYKGQPLIWHNGGTLGISSDISFLPDSNLGVVVVINRSAGDNFNHAVRDYIFELAFGLEHEADAFYMAAAESLSRFGAELTRHVTFGSAVDPERAAHYAGEYERGIVIAVKDEQLILVTAYGDVPLYPTDQENVFMTGGAMPGFSATFVEENDTTTLTMAVPNDILQTVTMVKLG